MSGGKIIKAEGVKEERIPARWCNEGLRSENDVVEYKKAKAREAAGKHSRLCHISIFFSVY